MKTYELITPEQALHISPGSLIDNYNDAVETIWHLQHLLKELRQENEMLWATYEDMSDKMYG